MEKFLAPWASLIRLEAYHGDISHDQAHKILSKEKPGSYILMQYDPERRGAEFLIARLSAETPTRIIMMRGLSFNWPRGTYWSCHPVIPKYAHEGHKYSSCRFETFFKHPVKLRNPHSLKEIARAKICEKLKYNDIQTLANEGEITQDCKEYIMEKSSDVKPCKSFVYCDLY